MPTRKKSEKKTTTRKTAGRGKKVLTETTEVLGILTWTDPLEKPTRFVMTIPFDPSDETGHICVSIKLRAVHSIELRPFRRPIHNELGVVDAEGHIEDAVRLANKP